MRLQKFLARQGVSSRRKAEDLILAGKVTVNGKEAGIGLKIDPSKDNILVNGKRIAARPQSNLTLMMNKPKDVVCTNRDPFHEKTIFSLLPAKYAKGRLYCAGRLDRESEGMVILTNDGDLANRLTHPRNRIVKRYRVWLDKPFDKSIIPRLKNGVSIAGERLKAEKIIPERKGGQPEKCLEMHLCHGRKKEIRRLLESVGYHVRRLYRFQIGGLVLRGVKAGHARRLEVAEIEKIFGLVRKFPGAAEPQPKLTWEKNGNHGGHGDTEK